MKRITRLWLAGWSLLMLAYPAAAQDGPAVLSRIDSVLTAFTDMTTEQQMTLIESDGSQKVREVKMYQKGPELRMIRFLSPAEVRGVGFLRLASDRLYLYLPAFRKVRRVASSIKNENFMGTDFTYEDMSQNTYGDDYRAAGLEEQDDRYRLELVPKAGADVSYARLVLAADKSSYVLREVQFYNHEGERVKVLTVGQIDRIDGYWMGRRMEMKDLTESHRTVLKLSNIAFDQGLSDDFFSERNLKRPPR